MEWPLAYLLTWRCYGTWLHGDPRGAVDDEHNEFGTPLLGRNRARVEFEESLLRSDPVVLSDHMRDIADRVMREHCRLRGWSLIALNVRTTHAHAVVAAQVAPGVIAGQLKAWSTRRLREAGVVGQEDPVWARRGSDRWLWDEKSVAAAVDYVMNRQ